MAKKTVTVTKLTSLTREAEAKKRREHIEPLLRGEQKPASARAVIEVFLMYSHSGSKQHPETMQWLAYALQRVIDGEDANRAFGLCNPRQRPPDLNLSHRRFRMAATVALLRRENPEWSTKKVMLTVQEKFSVTTRTIELAVKKHGDLKQIPSQILKDIAKDNED